MGIEGVNSYSSYSMDYLKMCDEQLKSHDKDNNGVTTVNEFIQSHNIQSKNYADFAKGINSLIEENKSVFQKYAGEDNNFTTVEYVELLNSSEWEDINAELNQLETQFGIGAESLDGNNSRLEEDFSLAAFMGERVEIAEETCKTSDDLCDSYDSSYETLYDTCETLDITYNTLTNEEQEAWNNAGQNKEQVNNKKSDFNKKTNNTKHGGNGRKFEENVNKPECNNAGNAFFSFFKNILNFEQ